MKSTFLATSFLTPATSFLELQADLLFRVECADQPVCHFLLVERLGLAGSRWLGWAIYWDTAREPVSKSTSALHLLPAEPYPRQTQTACTSSQGRLWLPLTEDAVGRTLWVMYPGRGWRVDAASPSSTVWLCSFCSAIANPPASSRALGGP